MSSVNDRLRQSLNEFNEKAAMRLADLLARASEKVDEEEARGNIKNVLNVISVLPSILNLAVNLVFDPRVPFMKKFQIGVIVAYMISPGEALIDALAGPVAYLDDAVLTLYIVFLVAQLIGSLGEDVIRDNWIGDPAHADELVKAAKALGGFLGTRVTVDQARDMLQPAAE
jgi:uncharacterized membrane protein YkvA (DUF1232 family)